MNCTMNRRRFLQFTALSPFALHSASAAYAPIPRTGKARFTPGLNAYSFLERLNANLADPTKGIDLFGVCDFCVKHDIEAVDLTGYFFPGYPKAPSDDYLARIKRYTHDRGITISGTGVKNDFATADKAVHAEGVALTKLWIEVAARLGAPVVRVFAGPQQKNPKDWQSAAGGASRDEVEKWIAEALRECAEHGEKFGVIVAVQNHGDFLSTGPEHISLLKRVDHAWCGALVDTGKYFTDDPYVDIAMMVPHAVNWQIKETLGSSLKSPPTDFKKLAKIIHDGGYRGFVPIETLAMGRKDYDPAAEVVKVLKAMRIAAAAIPKNP
ncbi:MAG: sugar phosphate isomerase/epimerase [Verrucomicrobia bacterium]|nr:sugar phosphate isomerase/epimerase [Verrucomicrobiota bacterium]NBU09919.1 sugar phosphate isomerase/epimerase [Pseudomonadota bacterium]NDA65925.1 sugar phosphate isomerase/epimerase [Verrucomicrobiota bacterium]NDB75142.1 sugar phosphate isomerase/epimerase [Verrucomicrobiota bacterium]NDD37253.1 sugar phosphate isomerase/epimerase [Verrucomicrobiota bacterium]